MFQRGFKAWCENVAREARRQLDLKPFEPLDPWKLAAQLGATVVQPEDIPGVGDEILRVLLKEDPDSWSAITLTFKPKPIMILNSAHSMARRTSSLAHEIAHLLIGHTPSQTGVSPDGLLLTAYDRPQEDEANWLAGCLLLPREACLYISKQGWDHITAARRYGVSRDMLYYRLNISGVEKQRQAWARKKETPTQV